MYKKVFNKFRKVTDFNKLRKKLVEMYLPAWCLAGSSTACPQRSDQVARGEAAGRRGTARTSLLTTCPKTNSFRKYLGWKWTLGKRAPLLASSSPSEVAIDCLILSAPSGFLKIRLMPEANAKIKYSPRKYSTLIRSSLKWWFYGFSRYMMLAYNLYVMSTSTFYISIQFES